MTPICITAPALEPLSLAEAKDWLKVDSTADDTLILELITAARIHIEQATRLLLLTQSWKLVADQWPCQRQWRGRIGASRGGGRADQSGVGGVRAL